MDGSSELEFALALPIFLLSVLTTVQVALMVNARLIVDYATFCAARAAVVWLPQNTRTEPPFVLLPVESDQSEKRARIERAARLAVLPISPRISRFRFGLSLPAATQQFDGASLARLVTAADRTVGARIDPLRLGAAAVDKWIYAASFTEVSLQDDCGQPRDQGVLCTVTARVTHKFEMAVPFAGPALGSMFGERYVPIIGGFYVPISADYTLMVAPS